jgi:hypothetical protein
MEHVGYRLLCMVTCPHEEFRVNPIGQDKIFNRAQWPVLGMAHNKMVFMICTMGMWIYTMDIWILHSSHIYFAQWACGFTQWTIWILHSSHIDFAQWACGF